MKTNIFTFMLLAASFISYSQTEDFVCGYDYIENENNTFNQTAVFSYSTDPAILYAKEPKVLNVYFWQVNKFGGQFGDDPYDTNTDITEEEVLSGIANLNIEFNQYNIFFKYRGLGQFDSPATAYLQERVNGYCQDMIDNQGNPIIDQNGFNTINGTCQISDLRSYAKLNGYGPEENINIYIPYATQGFRAAGSSGSVIMVIKRNDLDNKAMIHEMGHVLSLSHSHKGDRDQYDPLDELEPPYTTCEHVTRDPYLSDSVTPNPEYNAEIAGDIITDTAAVPNFVFEHYYELLEQGYSEVDAANDYIGRKYIDSIDCVYTGQGVDCLSEPYDIYDSDAQNIMSYTRESCYDTFTIGQAIRMHEIVELWIGHYGLADLADLFEPYKGEYYVAGPLPNNYQEPLFQPGFKYLFVECENNPTISTPQDYGFPFTYSTNTVLLSIEEDESDYNSITHPNHSAIQIKHAQGNFLDNPEKCYDNWNRKPSGGSVTKFNDNVLNTNVTITPQDSTSINNENLIQNLDTGLYKIKKNYNDGSSQETVILKENN